MISDAYCSCGVVANHEALSRLQHGFESRREHYFSPSFILRQGYTSVAHALQHEDGVLHGRPGMPGLRRQDRGPHPEVPGGERRLPHVRDQALHNRLRGRMRGERGLGSRQKRGEGPGRREREEGPAILLQKSSGRMGGSLLCSMESTWARMPATTSLGIPVSASIWASVRSCSMEYRILSKSAYFMPISDSSV